MDLYLSSPTNEVMDELVKRYPDQKFNILLTRARMPAGMDNYFERYGSVINKKALDCGAKSLNSSNLEITEGQLFAQLIEYTKSNQGKFDLVFSYDPNFDPDGFENNQLYFIKLMELGIRVVPVIHSMNTLHEVRAYVNAGCDRIAIGKQKDKTNPTVLFPAVFRLHEHGIKTHLFGVTQFDLLASCPVSSCDSKSWLDDALTGVVRYWNVAKDTFNKTDIIYFPDKLGGHKQGTIRYDLYDDIDGFKKFIDVVGFKVKDLLGMKGVRNRAILSMLYYKKIEEIVTAIHFDSQLFL